jgi:hypothetical protein
VTGRARRREAFSPELKAEFRHLVLCADNGFPDQPPTSGNSGESNSGSGFGVLELICG